MSDGHAIGLGGVGDYAKSAATNTEPIAEPSSLPVDAAAKLLAARATEAAGKLTAAERKANLMAEIVRDDPDAAGWSADRWVQEIRGSKTTIREAMMMLRKSPEYHVAMGRAASG